MELRRLPADRDAVRRYVEQLWLPYHRELETTVEAHALAEGVDLVATEVGFRLDWLDDDNRRAWVAVDGARDPDVAAGDGTLAGFVATDVDESPPVFDRPDRIVVCDIYVREPHRGTGLARRLMDRAAERAREAGCGELVLDADVDNAGAIAFYENCGFETRRRRMVASAEEL